MFYYFELYDLSPSCTTWKFSEDCFIFVIDDGKDAILSTHDTGYFTSEMFEYLEKSHLLLSIVSLDCTSQTNETGNSHMNWEENLKLIAELKERKLRHR